ncbi:MAG: right-handed parallel beta-helix repeat-containing protein [Candidatus Cloacimonetes bacterium]|nr:right-handed parallel beta-helix repeat-containing protein [Candidatus Cloacimonadota bacterium]
MNNSEYNLGRMKIFYFVYLITFFFILRANNTFNWGKQTVGTESTQSTHSRAMGGKSPSAQNMIINSISIYLGTEIQPVRLAVYVGGTADNPETAELLWDAGSVSSTGTSGWYTIQHPSGVSWTPNTYTWLAWKNSNSTVFFTYGSSGSGDFQSERGRNENNFDTSTEVVYPELYGTSGTFGLSWYSIYLTYSRPFQKYHVSPTGNDLNPGTITHPFCTVQTAANYAQAGDSIFVYSGIYPEQITLPFSGRDNHPIVFKAIGEDDVVISGLNVEVDNYGGLWQIVGKEHISIIGFRLENSNGSGFRVEQCSNILVESCSTYNTWSSGIKFRECHNFAARGNEIRKACNGGNEECITVAKSRNFDICENTVHDGSALYLGGEGIGIKAGSHHGMIHHNHVFDLPANYNPETSPDGEVGIYIDAMSFGSGIPIPGHEIWADSLLHDIDVFSNVVSTPVGIAVGAEEGGHSDNVRVFNNIVHHCFYHGIIITNWNSYTFGWKTNISIINNTVYRCGNPYGYSSHGIYIASIHPLDNNFIIRNNLLSDNYTFQIRVRETAGTVTQIDHNLMWEYHDISSEDVLGDAVILENPMFNDVLNNDLSISEISPARDSGSFISAPNFDINGIYRPQGEMIDIGAYEYQIIQLSKPTSLTISIVDNTVHLDWEAVIGATSYKIYGSDNIASGFIEISTVDQGTCWSESVSISKKFYRVVAYSE